VGLYTEGGQTAVVDAVYMSIENAAKYWKDNGSHKHHALILITDGVDLGSAFTRDELVDRLRTEDIQIFVIGLVRQVGERERKKALDLLNLLAQETGGQAFFPNSLSELRKVAQKITREIRTQYFISYIANESIQSNTFHRVQVTVAEAPGQEKRIAVARSGYFAAPKMLNIKRP
jgi:Ca-activated chloride channel family protein